LRGHLLTTSGRKLETVGQRDFIDIAYAYAVNSTEMRHEFRKAINGYAFDYASAEKATEDDMTFDGFTKQSISMLDELDAFNDGLG
jgi:hypothetical protein